MAFWQFWNIIAGLIGGGTQVPARFVFSSFSWFNSLFQKIYRLIRKDLCLICSLSSTESLSIVASKNILSTALLCKLQEATDTNSETTMRSLLFLLQCFLWPVSSPAASIAMKGYFSSFKIWSIESFHQPGSIDNRVLSFGNGWLSAPCTFQENV